MIRTLQVRSTRRCQLLDITSMVSDALALTEAAEALCHVYCPHTTAGIIINEGTDPDVAEDFLCRLEALAPRDAGYMHVEGNSDAHVKAALVGSSAVLPVERGRLLTGMWQRVFFCEFDGPRSRGVIVSVLRSGG